LQNPHILPLDAPADTGYGGIRAPNVKLLANRSALVTC
jgi:hypothetical protein